MTRMMRAALGLWVMLVVGLASTPARAITLGGVDVPKERFVVFLAIGHSNMAGRVDDIDAETYETHPRIWNFRIDDGTQAWVPAQPPVHRDVSWQRGGGPMTPMLKALAAARPDTYFGVLQNAHSSVTVGGDYRRGKGLYDELVTAARAISSDVTFGGVVAMLGFIESGNATQAADFGNQVSAMMAELRQDLGAPTLPLLINRLTRGRAYWQTVQSEIAALPGALSHCAIVPSDGPYKPGDAVHYTWAGEKMWGAAAANEVISAGWIAAAVDGFAPRIARTRVLDATTIEVIFDEALDGSTVTSAAFGITPALAVLSATLDVDPTVVTLSSAPMMSGSIYTLTVAGLSDTQGNATAALADAVRYDYVDITRTSMGMWLRADQGVVRDTVNSVPLWADQSGNGNDAIMARFANHPVWVDAALGAQPVLRFGGPQDSEGDYLSRQRSAPYTGDSTLFVVGRLTSLGQPVNASMFASDSNGGSRQSYQLQVDGADPGTFELYTDRSYPIMEATTDPFLLTVRVAGTALEVFVDGVSLGSFSIAADEAKHYDLISFGHNRGSPFEHLPCEISEVLFYEDALALVERERVEAHLGKKYGLIVSPAGVTVSPTGGLVTSEAGGIASFSIVLDRAPTADVTIPLVSDTPAEATVSPTSVTFSAADWSVARTVVVTGVDDTLTDGDRAYAIRLGPVVSADPSYGAMSVADLLATNLDDEGVANLPPVASIAGPVQARVGIAVSLYGGGSTDDGPIASYQWDFGDGANDAGDLVSHAWSQPGSYTVTLTVTDGGGLRSTVTHDILVDSAPQPTATLLYPTGGERLEAGTSVDILWTTVDLDDVRIDVSVDGGGTWELVGYSDVADPDWGSMAWLVPDIVSEHCIVMVRGYNLEGPDQSAPFAIGALAAPDQPPPLRSGCRAQGGASLPAAFLALLLLRPRRRRDR